MGYIIKPQDARVGLHINMWTILELPQSAKEKAICQCDCGNKKGVKLENILRGISLRCRNCSTRNFTKTHGESDSTGNTRLYRIWKAMKWRCNPKNKTSDYEMYYARGIRVCDQWVNNYETFRDWSIENGYTDKLTIDRFPDKNGNYHPTNCRWADGRDQCRNTRRNLIIVAFGETKSAIEWSEDQRCSINDKTLRRRIHLGWDSEKAITKIV